jgi:hypothetical protein
MGKACSVGFYRGYESSNHAFYVRQCRSYATELWFALGLRVIGLPWLVTPLLDCSEPLAFENGRIYG